MNITIRKETTADYPVVYQVVQSAFQQALHTNHDEQNLVERLRKSDAYIPALSLVAEVDGKVVGHIMFTRISVGDKQALALAPLSVIPEFQNQGIGSRLITSGHEIAKEMGFEWCILVGHAAYYPRFGYKKASAYGIQSPFEVPEDAFMALHLQGNEPMLNGMVIYPAAFEL